MGGFVESEFVCNLFNGKIAVVQKGFSQRGGFFGDPVLNGFPGFGFYDRGEIAGVKVLGKCIILYPVNSIDPARQ